MNRSRIALYWVATLIIAAECAIGGMLGLLKVDYVQDVLVQDLEYPSYVAVLLGAWKVPGAVVLLIPRSPQLKEWVYAGTVFVYTGSAFSFFFVGSAGAGIGSLGFAAVAVISWALRPPERRDLARQSTSFARLLPDVPRGSRGATIAYWVVTVTFTGVLLSGGVVDLAHRPATVDGMVALGYPEYFLYIIGFWKVLTPAAIFAPGLERLKEWAYVGSFFNFSGAVVSHLVSGSEWYHVAYTSLFTLFTVMSWALRPSRNVRIRPDVSEGAAAPRGDRQDRL